MDHFNNVGSTMAVTDAAGKVQRTYRYSPYGELIEGVYDGLLTFLYNGQYGVATDENGLYYMRARYYNVDIKRFINQDVLAGTLERITSLNRYAYAEGNPVSYLDPFGLEKWIYEGLHNKVTRVAYSVNAIAWALGQIGSKPMLIFNALVIGFDFGVYLFEFINEGFDLSVLLEGIAQLLINIALFSIGIAVNYNIFSNVVGEIDNIISLIKSCYDTYKSYQEK